MSYRQFWGKARPDPGAATGISAHPLMFHNLDVAAVGAVWLEAAPARAEAAARAAGLDRSLLRAFVPFLLALHDAGKFSRTFQSKAAAHWPPCLGPAPAAALFDPGHDTIGFALLIDDGRLDLAPLLGHDGVRLGPLLRAITGHHGRPPEETPDVAHRAIVDKFCRQALADYAAAVHAVLSPPLLPPLPDRIQRRLGWWLAGLTVLADWVGSSQHWFAYRSANDVPTLDAYWHQHALPAARRALRDAGLAPTPTFVGGFDPIGPDRTPTPVQTLAQTAALPPGPTLVVIEDATGAGKTEAALILAHRLMADGRADGVFVALPTMATADAMFARVARAYRALFAADASPSLALAHGRALENPLFRNAILPAVADGAADAMPVDEAGETATAQCAAWLASDRRRTFLADVGVGTIDQALLGVLPTRHAPLRLFGLCRKILIIDEAHAYDAYMHQELERLLTFHALLGGSAIVLSATLPQIKRAALVAAFRQGLGAPAATLTAADFPLVTIAAAGEAAEHPTPTCPGPTRTVTVERLATPDDVVRRLVSAARAGACVAWVRNTVDDAIEGAALLRAEGIEPILFHARFALVDRLAIQDRILATFGPGGTGRAGQVVVATQVIEQSLDLDFDLLASDLAPIDLLIQRAGRLWRHDRASRPIDGPRLLVLSPEPVDDPPPDWAVGPLGGTRFVYDPPTLWRSARTLFAAGAIHAPHGLRDLVEAVYPAELPDPPPGLQRADNTARSADSKAKAAASYALLEPGKGYSRSAGPWGPDEHVPTRLGDLGRAFRLARREQGALVPYVDHVDPHRAWTLSEITLRSTIATDAPLTPEVETVRANWRRWERDIPVLVLNNVHDGWSAHSVRGENTQRLHYSATFGLVVD